MWSPSCEDGLVSSARRPGWISVASRATQVTHRSNLPFCETRHTQPRQPPSGFLRPTFSRLTRATVFMARQQKMMTSHMRAPPSPFEADCPALASVNTNAPRKIMTPQAAETPMMAGSSRLKLFTYPPLGESSYWILSGAAYGEAQPGWEQSQPWLQPILRIVLPEVGVGISGQPNCFGRKEPVPHHD